MDVVEQQVLTNESGGDGETRQAQSRQQKQKSPTGVRMNVTLKTEQVDLQSRCDHSVDDPQSKGGAQHDSTEKPEVDFPTKTGGSDKPKRPFGKLGKIA